MSCCVESNNTPQHVVRTTRTRRRFFGPYESAAPVQLTLGHLRAHLTTVLSQPDSPRDSVFRTKQSSHLAESGQSQDQQSLSALILPSPFSWLLCRYMVDGGGWILGPPFTGVTREMTSPLAPSRESQSLSLRSRASLNFLTVTFRALGRTHIGCVCVVWEVRVVV